MSPLYLANLKFQLESCLLCLPLFQSHKSIPLTEINCGPLLKILHGLVHHVKP